jgi:3-hydroxymyristoyl/3-hydroxydecanoyl-(acyl carrier protein) dehydratase
VPGVILLDTVIQYARTKNQTVARMINVKFMNPLLPEKPFQVALSPSEQGFEFRVVADGETYVSGTIICRERTPLEER